MMRKTSRRVRISKTSTRDRNENPTYIPMKPPRELNSFAVCKSAIKVSECVEHDM